MTVKRLLVAPKHTDGPWELRTNDGSYAITAVVCPQVSSEPEIIARLMPRDWPATPANGRLMAASVDLLAALCALVETFEYKKLSSSRQTVHALMLADAAIRKATGQHDTTQMPQVPTVIQENESP
jgi:hypothetical protein